MPGNRLRVLRDARENYPAWAAAIESARRTIHLEMYIVHDDATGRVSAMRWWPGRRPA